MKKEILNVVAILSVITTMSIAGFAGLSRSLEANIPFDFMVNGKKLSAGKYTVTSGGTQKVLHIRSWKLKQGAFAIARELEASGDNKPRLIFHRYGDQYFLAKVIGSAGAIELPKSRAEQKAEKSRRDELTMNDAAPEIIMVSAQVGQ